MFVDRVPEEQDEGQTEAVAPVGPKATTQVGDLLNNRFELLEVIGEGGTGLVYRSHDRTLGREVAVKVLDLKFDPRKDPSYQQRFENEAALTSRLIHPNIVVVFDRGETPEGLSYIAMELLKGVTLHEALKREGPIGYARAAAITIQICRGVRDAHALGLVHRDLKPANVMLIRQDDSEVVKVLDFGLAKPFLATREADLTQTGVFFGSPAYMAPEQARNEASPQSDIYSVGIMLFRMLTGQVPFSAKTPIDVIVKHLQAPVPQFRDVAPQLEIPQAIEAIVRQCLDKDPKNRFSSMGTLIDALKQAVGADALGGYIPSPRSQSGEQLATAANSSPPLAIPPPPPVDDESAAAPAGLFSHAKPESTLRPKRQYNSLLVSFIVTLSLGLIYLIARTDSPETNAAATVTSINTGTATVQPKPTNAPSAVETKTGGDDQLNKLVRFRINTIPAGASLKVGGKVVGSTPVTFDVQPDGEGLASANVSLSLDGFQSLSFTASGYGPEVVMVQRLHEGNQRVVLPPQIATRQPKVEKPTHVAKPSSAPVTPASSVSATLLDQTLLPPRIEPKQMIDPQPPLVQAVAPSPAPTTPPIAVAPPVMAQPHPVEEEQFKRPELVDPGKPPEYTREAIEARIEGTAVAKCLVTLRGDLTRCRMVKSLAFMDEAYLSSLKTRRYKPAEMNGKPVEIEIPVTMRLVLRN